MPPPFESHWSRSASRSLRKMKARREVWALARTSAAASSDVYRQITGVCRYRVSTASALVMLHMSGWGDVILSARHDELVTNISLSVCLVSANFRLLIGRLHISSSFILSLSLYLDLGFPVNPFSVCMSLYTLCSNLCIYYFSVFWYVYLFMSVPVGLSVCLTIYLSACMFYNSEAVQFAIFSSRNSWRNADSGSTRRETQDWKPLPVSSRYSDP